MEWDYIKKITALADTNKNVLNNKMTSRHIIRIIKNLRSIKRIKKGEGSY